MALYLYEFLYRGRPPGDAEASAYHVVLAAAGTDAFGQATTAIGPAMTPDQARAKGFDLPAIVAAINTEVMAENAALKADLAKREADQLIPADAPA